MSSEPLSGWTGTRQELLHVLDTFGVDKNEKGDFLLYHEPVIVGLDGDVVVHQNTMCKIDGKPVRVAHLLQQTSYGMAVVVI